VMVLVWGTDFVVTNFVLYLMAARMGSEGNEVIDVTCRRDPEYIESGATSFYTE